MVPNLLLGTEMFVVALISKEVEFLFQLMPIFIRQSTG